MPPYTGTHTAHPTGGPYGSWRRVLEAHVVLGGELREADTLPGTPVLPICRMLPVAGVMRPRGWGLGAGCGGRRLRCPELSFGLASPHGVKAETSIPHFPPPLLWGRGLQGQKLRLLGARMCPWACVLCPACARALTALLFPAGDGVSGHHQEPH